MIPNINLCPPPHTYSQIHTERLSTKNGGSGLNVVVIENLPGMQEGVTPQHHKKERGGARTIGGKEAERQGGGMNGRKEGRKDERRERKGMGT